MTARTSTSTSLLRDAVAAELHAAGSTARNAARKPTARWAAGIAATAAVGAIAVTAAAPWASAATPTSATRDLAVKAAAPVPAGFAAKPAATGHATGTAHATAAAAKHAAASAKPSVIYDSVTPSSIPAGKDAAVYADGSYQASAASVSARKHVLWIDTNGSRTDADVLDVEPGDATPAGAATWVKAKLTKSPGATAIVYTFKSNWAPTIASIDALPAAMKSHVKYWIADPTGTPHILPGAEATQWYWGPNYDISAAKPGFNS